MALSTKIEIDRRSRTKSKVDKSTMNDSIGYGPHCFKIDCNRIIVEFDQSKTEPIEPFLALEKQ